VFSDEKCEDMYGLIIIYMYTATMVTMGWLFSGIIIYMTWLNSNSKSAGCISYYNSLEQIQKKMI